MRKLVVVFLASSLLAGPALADDSLTHLGKAIDGTSQVAGHLAASGVETAAVVSVVPLAVGASVAVGAGASVAAGGVAVAATGSAVAQAVDDSTADFGRPLYVDKRVFVMPDPAPRVPYAPPVAK
ncbi:MAG: hypothetical protein WCI21_02745 [Alphaproteobacteria bacterium]